MKLKEQLKLFKGIDIKVGAETSFFYCDICDDNTEKIIEEASDNELKRLNNLKFKIENYLENFETLWNKRIENKVNKLKLTQKKTIEYEKEKLKKAKKEIREKALNDLEVQFIVELEKLLQFLMDEKKQNYENTIKRLSDTKRRIKEFTPFLEREILEIYDSVLNEGEKIIRIYGEEVSPYWDKEEYLKAKKRMMKNN